MTDKQQIEKLTEALNKYARAYGKSFETVYGEYTVARTLIDFGMLPLLLPEDAVVLTREELEDMVKAKMKCISDMAIIARKETTKELINKFLIMLAGLVLGREEDTVGDNPLSAKGYFFLQDKLKELAKQLGVEVD